MTFDLQNFGRETYSSSGSPDVAPYPYRYRYKNTSDTLSTILAAGYFDAKYPNLRLNDEVMIHSSDYPNGVLCYVSTVDTSTTPHYTLDQKPGFGGEFQLVSATTGTTAGGDANETFTVTGAAVGDYVLLQARTGSAGVHSAYVSASNTITSVFSGDPGAGIVVEILVFRKL